MVKIVILKILSPKVKTSSKEVINAVGWKYVNIYLLTHRVRYSAECLVWVSYQKTVNSRNMCPSVFVL